MESNLPNPYSTPSANLYGAASGEADAVSPGTIAQLAGTKPWVRFISVMLWIGVGLMILVSIGMGAVMAMGFAGQAKSGPFGGAEMIVLVAIYGVMAFLYIYPAMKLWAFANRIGSLNSTRSVADLDAALTEQRRFWKFFGIMMIIVICIYIIFIIGMIGFGATAAMKASAIPR